jgi:hypothetical protein
MATAPASAPITPKSEIRIISHSGLFYWWPVWAIGYLMALLTAFSGIVMAEVPAKTEVKKATALKVPLNDKESQDLADRMILIIPKDSKHIPPEPRLHISSSKNLGVVWCITLLLVITITNIPLRGLWSVIVIIFIVLLALIFALAGIWNNILETVNILDIRITLGGYVFVSTVLLILWLIAFILFDQQVYMVFTPGQFRVRLEIGEGETAYDTTGMTIQKQRSDLFRHWILGLGSGDLIVRTSGAQAHHFDLPNVLFLGRKVKEIEEMLRSRQVVAAPRA